MRLALPERLRQAVRQSGLRFIVTGAGGWIGGATLELLADALGPAEFASRVVALAASARRLRLVNGVEVELLPLAALERLDPGSSWSGSWLLLHYAFLGREKVASMSLADYVAANEAIGLAMRRAISRLKPRGVFLSSSGAVYGPDGGIDDDLARNPYGVMKRRDEIGFAAACGEAGARLTVTRIFNLAGAYINKLEGYALACFIGDALARRPIAIRANRPVERSYVHVGDVVALGLADLLDPAAPAASPPTTFDTAGERIVEMGELAEAVRVALSCPALAIQRPPLDPALARDRYVGDPKAMRALAERHGLAFVELEEQIRSTAGYLSTVNPPAA